MGSLGVIRSNEGRTLMNGIDALTKETPEAERQRIDAFELCWRRLSRVPQTARRPNQSILREINPEYSLEEAPITLAT